MKPNFVFITMLFISAFAIAKNKLDLNPTKKTPQQNEKSVDLDQFKGMNLEKSSSGVTFTATCSDQVGGVHDQNSAGYEKCLRESGNLGNHKKPEAGVKVGK